MDIFSFRDTLRSRRLARSGTVLPSDQNCARTPRGHRPEHGRPGRGQINSQSPIYCDRHTPVFVWYRPMMRGYLPSAPRILPNSSPLSSGNSHSHANPPPAAWPLRGIRHSQALKNGIATQILADDSVSMRLCAGRAGTRSIEACMQLYRSVLGVHANSSEQPHVSTCADGLVPACASLGPDLPSPSIAGHGQTVGPPLCRQTTSSTGVIRAIRPQKSTNTVLPRIPPSGIPRYWEPPNIAPNHL
jgi:hypothetical protein